jgi:hypothetical protein
MDAPRPPLVLLSGGRPASAPDRRSLARLRLHNGGEAADLEEALAEAVETARLMRLEIERRIARALDAFQDRG